MLQLIHGADCCLATGEVHDRFQYQTFVQGGKEQFLLLPILLPNTPAQSPNIAALLVKVSCLIVYANGCSSPQLFI